MPTEKSSWWSRRTSLEKKLSVICGIVAVLAIAFLIALIVVAVNSNSSTEEDICLTEEDICLTQACIAESSIVLEQMNQEADPCDDFYEFACGTFLRNTVIPDDKTTVTAFSLIENELKDHLRALVEAPIEADEIEPFQNVKRLYRACLDTNLIETIGETPLMNVINNIGGWPTINPGWSEATWTWPDSVQRSGENGYSVSYFMSFSVSTDNKNSSRRIIRIDQTSLGLAKEYITNETHPFRIAYHEYQKDLAELFGANPTIAEQDMQAVLNFETALAEISLDREQRRDAELLYNNMTVEELSNNASFAYRDHNWLNYFNNILPPQSQLTLSDTIIVGAVSFFEQLGSLLTATSDRTMANYVAWRVLFSSVNYLPRRFRERQLIYEGITTGRTEANPRWLECVDTTLSYYPHAFGALYVRSHFDMNAKERALEMVNNIKDEFKIMLSEITWMDDITKQGANEKADTIREEIGFADELLNNTALTEYYAIVPVVVNENNYYQAIRDLNVASALRNNMRLREDIDKLEWSSHVAPAIVNAYYSSLQNRIAFPAGILQGAFFNPDRPQYMNYGGIGFVIGHEITHGFDDQGSQYDANGDLNNWWANETRDEYRRRADCIVYQYGNYTEPLTGLPLSGLNTQGENIADNGGIKESYRAYNRWAASNPEPRMPGLNYTPQQMFWISAGQVWCSVYREAAMRNRVTTGVHSPGQFRVIGPMSNMQEFSNDFQCGAEANMNPAEKCEVW